MEDQMPTTPSPAVTSPRVCFDRILPRDLRRLAIEPLPAAPVALQNPLGTPRAAIFLKKRWPNGSTLRVRFLEGSASQQAIVQRFAPQWSNYANLKLDFGSDPAAEIRVTFKASDGAWSYIGTDCADIPRDQPTMNLGWQDEGVVLHEFGHTIGLIHEHQNPVGGIKWNRPAVIRALSGPPNNWDLDTIERNMFQRYSVDLVKSTTLDPRSIMMYSFPAEWTLDGFSTRENDVLSDQDKEFIGSGVAYPKTAQPVEPTKLSVNGAETKAEIGKPGEEDLFQFSVTTPGRYAIQTTGQTDVFMTLYGPNSQTALIDQDDDSGPGLNASIVEKLGPGTYFVQVRHYNRHGGKGAYGISVSSK
jgi:Bacterial pre-peptidase C-terminal domain/Astacin (Peptidase family M12A)